MYSIKKQFEFCYGHRVYTQQLDEKLAGTTQCKCRHLHGHQAKLEVMLTSPTLNEQGMVTDFAHLNWLKEFIDTYFDHKMILSINDPLLAKLFATKTKDDLTLEMRCMNYNGRPASNDPPVLYTLDVKNSLVPCLTELFEGITLINDVPTSEVLSCFFFYLVDQHFKERLGAEYRKQFEVISVTFWETPKSNSTYHG